MLAYYLSIFLCPGLRTTSLIGSLANTTYSCTHFPSIQLEAWACLVWPQKLIFNIFFSWSRNRSLDVFQVAKLHVTWAWSHLFFRLCRSLPSMPPFLSLIVLFLSVIPQKHLSTFHIFHSPLLPCLYLFLLCFSPSILSLQTAALEFLLHVIPPCLPFSLHLLICLRQAAAETPLSAILGTSHDRDFFCSTKDGNSWRVKVNV